MTMSKKLNCGLFTLLLAASFVLPLLFEDLRNHAPGVAIIAGILYAVLIGNPFAAVTSKWTHNLLGIVIIGMGFGMNLISVLRAGMHGFAYTIVGICLGMGLGILLGKRLGIKRDAVLLISVGTSICGGSAIAAVAPVLKAKGHDIAISTAIVFLLNAVALLIFPAIGRYFNMEQPEFGVWAALAIHDTSSVVGAAMQYGHTSLEIATTVKLARALWIVPVALAIFWYVKRTDKNEASGKAKISVPWFIPGFLAAAAIVTFLPQTQQAGEFAKDISKYLMVSTLFLIGANISGDKIRELGLKSVLHGVTLWITLSVLWLFAILSHIVKC